MLKQDYSRKMFKAGLRQTDKHLIGDTLVKQIDDLGCEILNNSIDDMLLGEDLEYYFYKEL